jgi:hypothetical protein
MHARHKSLPEGFKEHKPGEPCPLPPDARVELMIRTKAGLGSSGVTSAKMHDWKAKGLGAVHGYRTVQMFAGLE